MRPKRDTPREDEKAEAIRHRFTRRKMTDTREESETTLTRTVGPDGSVHHEHRERRESHSRSLEQIEFNAGTLGEEPAPISPDAESSLPPADFALLPRPNRPRLPSGSEGGAADEESSAAR